MLSAAWTAIAAAAKQPNFVFILTDDQDLHMDSLDYMPLLHKHIIQEGTSFDQHYCTVSICCPSRVNIWTGLTAHRNNVTDLFPPYGGYPKFVREGLNDNWLPVFLQQLGYNTYYTGKLFNSHNVDNYNDPPVNGFNGSDFLLDPYTYSYYGAYMSRNFEPPVSYEGLYSPDVIAEKAYGFLEEASQHSDPFFIGVAPIAPHSDFDPRKSKQMTIPLSAPRHAHLFKDYQIPRTANFNPTRASGVGWTKQLERLNDTVIEYNDEFQRGRLRALQAVDEMVEGVVRRLDERGLLDNTYVIYTTDNGYHISHHRLPPGKECPFETDIHIPLAIRGPGVPVGHVAGVVSSHTDLTPTILKLAGSDRPDLDGSPIPLTIEELQDPDIGEHVNVEFWGQALPEGKYGKLGNSSFRPGEPSITARNNTYKALRLIGDGYNLLYAVWCTGDKQYYDLNRDPGQIENLLDPDFAQLAERYSLAGRSFKHVVDRLDSLLMVTKSCKAHTCRRPWETLHPNGKVRTLKDALRSHYDAFYSEQAKVSFSSCPLGHLISEEGPQEVIAWNGDVEDISSPGYGKQKTFDYTGHWSWWT
ncbi:Arylsulfatase [Pseudocercospora fuligena]|uniref:Arylsulfatase n=1 Tax=Pseudocercospora fuligena TaxID=685502 RepID=A0A8H6R874_9PEZI|nr:Arylsulfatase [Pseudocercospora fuligena]